MSPMCAVHVSHMPHIHIGQALVYGPRLALCHAIPSWHVAYPLSVLPPPLCHHLCCLHAAAYACKDMNAHMYTCHEEHLQGRYTLHQCDMGTDDNDNCHSSTS